MSGPRTSEKELVRAYRRETSSGGAVRVSAVREPPLRFLLESRALLALLALVALPAVYLLLARSVTRTFSGRAAAVFQGTVTVGLGAVGLAYLHFSMDY